MVVVLLVVNFDCKVQGHGRIFTKFLSRSGGSIAGYKLLYSGATCEVYEMGKVARKMALGKRMLVFDVICRKDRYHS